MHQILGDDLSGQDSVEWLTLLPEIVCDTMVRRLMGRKHPISEELDAQSLYRDHAEWHTRLLPKVQKVVRALAGVERPAPAGNAASVGTPGLPLPFAFAGSAPRKHETQGQMSLGDDRV